MAQKKPLTSLDVDTPEMKAMRKTVVEQELSARSWRAYYEKMYFSLEAEKLEPEYKLFQERQRDKIEADKAKMDEFMKNLSAKMEAGKVVDFTPKEVEAE